MRFLSNRLYRPEPPSPCLRRRRIEDALSRGVKRKLVLVCAPAGFGKTTAIAQWLQAIEGAAAWVSLDSRDGDPLHFLADLATSLSQVESSIGEGALAALAAPQPPSARSLTERVMQGLESLEEDVRIVLDDYQLVASSPAHGVLALLLEHLPGRVHLVLSTRVEPALPLARMRVLGDLAEIGDEELSFSVEEAARFLLDCEALDLSREDIVELERRTEGWVTGLRLAALSLREHPEPARFIRSFGGGHRHVFDYLAEEVLGRQTDDLRSFLLETSLLSRLSDSVCAAITGSPGAARALREIERRRLFLEPLDDSRFWYRYHHLFGEFLRRQLRAERTERAIAAIHRRAAGWYAANRNPGEAVVHLLAAGDGAGAAAIVEQALPGLAARSETYAELVTLLTQLPPEVVHARPRLALELAWALSVSGRPGDPELLLRSAMAGARTGGLEASQRRELLGIACAIRAARAASASRSEASEREGRRALALLPRDDHRWRASVNVGLGLARLAARKPRAAEPVLREAVERSRADGDRAKVLWALEALGRSLEHQGRLVEAARVYEQGIRGTRDLGRFRATWQGAVGGASYVGLARVSYEWNDLAQADEKAQEGLALAEGWEMPDVIADVVIPGNLLRARIHHAAGNENASADALARAREAALRLGRWPLGEEVEAARVALWLAGGKTAAAKAWLDDLEGRVEELDEWSPTLRFVACRVIANDSRRRTQIAAASRWLESWRAECEDNGSTESVIATRLAEARAHYARGDVGKAEQTLLLAVVAARPGGYLRKFLDDGPPLVFLLTRLLKVLRGSHDEVSAAAWSHVSRVLRCVGVDAPLERSSPGEALGLAFDPLSERELQVLEEVQAGLSNRRIAEKLGISPGTVKRHLSNIYGKLTVRSRTEALARARNLRLLKEARCSGD